MIRNSLRAAIGALLPLAAWHAVDIALGLAGYARHRALIPTPDRVMWIALALIGLDAALLWAGHLLLRRTRRPTRTAYATIGGVAAALGYAFAQWFGVRIAAPLAGSTFIGAILPIVAGMMAGFLYAQFAGREAQAADEAPGFDGPLQVRTSVAGIAIAATSPALLVSALAIPLGFFAFGKLLPHSQQPDPEVMQLFRLWLPAQALLETLFMTIIPAAIVVCGTHAIARSLGLLRGTWYALIGAAVSCLAAVLLASFIAPVVLFPMAAIAGAMMGGLYRLFAGLEPLALPEPVLVADEASLVGADHPSRRVHAVIREG